jgi:predicted thioesterase
MEGKRNRITVRSIETTEGKKVMMKIRIEEGKEKEAMASEKRVNMKRRKLIKEKSYNPIHTSKT